MLKVIVKNDRIVLELPFNKKGNVSKSEKSLIHATTNGNPNVALPSGEMVSIGVNVYSPNPDYVKTDKKK